MPDALSRLEASNEQEEEEGVLESLNVVTMVEMDKASKKQLLKAYEEDKQWSNISGMLETAEPGSTSFSRDEDGLIWRDQGEHDRRLCIPKALEGDIFETMHDEQFHIGYHRLYARIIEHYYIRNPREDSFISASTPSPETAPNPAPMRYLLEQPLRLEPASNLPRHRRQHASGREAPVSPPKRPR